MFKKSVSAALLLLTASLVSGCGCGKKQPVETEPQTTIAETTEAETEPETTEPETEPETEAVVYDDDHGPNGTVRSYLTGQWVDPEIGRNRPIAVMISNVKAAQPTYGLSYADVVYEAPNEASAVRFMALFEDFEDCSEIGSIRSARTYHTVWEREWEAVFFHYGQSAYAKPYLNSTAVDNVNGVTGASEWAYHSKSGRVSPHHHFTNPEEIEYAIKKLGYRRDYSSQYEGHYQFAKDDETVTLIDPVDCTRIDVGYLSNKPWFEYNEEDGLYYRYQFEDKHIDAENDEWIKAKNIIVQICDYDYYDSTDYLNINFWSGGRGMYITDGKMMEVTWDKEDDWAVTHYFDPEGNEITLNQGKTWVFIVRATREKYVSINETPITEMGF